MGWVTGGRDVHDGLDRQVVTFDGTRAGGDDLQGGGPLRPRQRRRARCWIASRVDERCKGRAIDNDGRRIIAVAIGAFVGHVRDLKLAAAQISSRGPVKRSAVADPPGILVLCASARQRPGAIRQCGCSRWWGW